MFMLKTIGCDSSQMVYIPQVLKINCFFLHTRDGDYQGETWQKICRKRSCLWAKSASWYRLIKTVPHGPSAPPQWVKWQGVLNKEPQKKKKKEEEPSYFVICLLVNFYSHRQKKKMMKLWVSTTVGAKFLLYWKMVASLTYIRFPVDSLLIIWRIGPLGAHTSLPPAWLLPWNFHFSSKEKKTSIPQRRHTENPSLTQVRANWRQMWG